MARTKTQKALLKAERSGTWCAERNRRQNDHYGAISQHVRVTPSKQQKLNKVKHKERIFQDGAPFACPGDHSQFTLCKLLAQKSRRGCPKSHEMAAWDSLRFLSRIGVSVWCGHSANGPLFQSLLSPDFIYSP